MDLIILLPAIACWIVLARGPIRNALGDVYLPVVLLLPHYYVLRFAHLPPVSFAEMAALPLFGALWFREMRRWRFDWMDLFVLLFALSAGLSEGMSTSLADGTWRDLFSVDRGPVAGDFSLFGLQFFAGLMTMGMPYMFGKLLVEGRGADGQAMRNRVVRRMVMLLAIVSAISVFDFLTHRSIWQMVMHHFFRNQVVDWPTQVRWGFGRIQGPYAHAILAGMIFLMGVIYVLWLRAFSPQWGTRRIFKGLPITFRGLILVLIVGGLMMTQSRGPWIAVGLALVLAMLVRVFSLGKATLAFVVVLIGFSAVAYTVGNRYTDVGLNQAKTEEQRNAVYRRELIRAYFPIIEERKAFGWGFTTLPVVNGQQSVDNEYLLVAATQGFTGLALFVTILLGSGVRLYRLAQKPLRMEDRALVFAHLTVLMGLAISLTTVYLGEQALLMLFFLLGWIQAMKGPEAEQAFMPAASQAVRFHRVLT
jgi:hypothetical protein